MRFVSVACLVAFCHAVFSPVGANTDEYAVSLYKRVTETVTGLEDYYIEGTFSVDVAVMGMNQKMSAPFVLAAKSPGKTHMAIDDEALGVLIVCDGEATWSYFEAFGQYKKETSVPIFARGTMRDAADQGMASTPGNFLTYYSTFDPERMTIRFAGRDSVEFGGVAVACERLEMTYTAPDTIAGFTGPDTLWVDPQRAWVLVSAHHMEGDMQGARMAVRTLIDYDLIETGQPPPDELFVFTPPEGAVEVGNFSFAGMSTVDLSGEAAPDFGLEGLDGRAYRLGDLKGKVVLIDFWATWCAPCRKELPTIEKFHRAYKDQGLVVLAITAEPAKVAAPFVKKYDYTFPVLIDVEQKVYDEYQVDSIPVVLIIDREGRIAAHIIGLRDEADLLGALKRAGIQ